jgi:hypothetical protein
MDMPGSVTHDDQRHVAPHQPPRSSAICPCGHPDERHDPVAARYCRATTSSQLDRGCICHAEAGMASGRA